jgi:outer membrane protein OmpA-like peptidoglycan-associated protein
MSALMTLFLVVMAVTLIAITKTVTVEVEASKRRSKDIQAVMAKIQKNSAVFKEVKVDEKNFRIDLGDVVLFDKGNAIIKADAAQFLRAYIPILLSAKATPEGDEWMRRIVVEGFTDQDGTYLYNLGLSLERSRSVVCVMFAKPADNEVALNESQKRQIRDLFLVGGYSFNSTRKNKAESRRVELKIEFRSIGDEKPPAVAIEGKDFGQC